MPKETIEEHFNKILPYMGFDYYTNCCCRNLDDRIERPDYCEFPTESTCKACWDRPYEVKGE